MSNGIKDDFEEKALKLFKVLTAKLTFLQDSGGPINEIRKLFDEAKEDFFKGDYRKSSDKYEEANGRLIQLVKPLAKSLLIVELIYLAVWLVVAYSTYRFPHWWIWDGIINDGTTAAWYGVLGGITIAIFGIYNHIRLGDFDPRFKLWYICKPIIGGIFGWFVYGLYVIGFVTVQQSDVEIKNPIFIYVIAFLAGFSERFILRMIDKLMAVITSYDESQVDKNENAVN